jgi:hypothetical protein
LIVLDHQYAHRQTLHSSRTNDRPTPTGTEQTGSAPVAPRWL